MSEVEQVLEAPTIGEETKSPGFGAFFGVFLPSALSIFGVIMYLRLGSILGRIGLYPTLAIIGVSSLITLLAALSISSIATNMKVDKGGVYYMISRSLGIDFGSAIGIPLYIAQTIGIAFFIMGFSETFHALFPQYDPQMISLITLGALGLLGYISTSFVLKTQGVIFLAIIASLVSLFLSEQTYTPVTYTRVANSMGYWAAFAIFFPAVTGIEAGISMSGVLKNPSRSIPIGTIAAVISGLIVYVCLALFLAQRVPRALLAAEPLICQDIARWKVLIVVGIFGATLSSALGAILGAPRTLQAIAEDGVVFRFLGLEHGANKEPRIAMLFTLLLAAVFISFGKIDAIAPILTMFFLISYGILNLVCGLETVMGNPSWRPTFQIPYWASFGGALLCFIAMLMINAGATLLALLAVFLIYFFRGRKLSSNWDDMCFGIMMYFIKTTVYKLKSSGTAARSWRPHLLIFSPSTTPPSDLMAFSSKLTKNNSFLTFASIIEEDNPYNVDAVEKAVNSSLKKYRMQGFVTVEKVEKVSEGYQRLALSHGIGPLTHNTVVLKHTQQEFYPELICKSYRAGKNVIILRTSEEAPEGIEKIDLWWNSAQKKTSELLLVLAHMYQSSVGSRHVQVTIKSIVSSETAREQRHNYFVELFANSRLRVDYKIYVANVDEEFKMMNHFSEDADLTFLGMPGPKEDENLTQYIEVYNHHMKHFKKLKKIAFVVAAEPVEFKKLFQ